MKMNKKAVSGIITSMLLILLVIAAVAIFWMIIKPFLESKAGSIENQAVCLETRLEILSAVPDENDQGYNLTVVIERKGSSIEDINFLAFYVDGEFVTFRLDVASSEGDMVPRFDNWRWPRPGETLSYVLNMTDLEGNPYGSLKSLTFEVAPHFSSDPKNPDKWWGIECPKSKLYTIQDPRWS